MSLSLMNQSADWRLADEGIQVKKWTVSWIPELPVWSDSVRAIGTVLCPSVVGICRLYGMYCGFNGAS